ncbi:MAG: site-specific DNA-methyltransferase [Sedimentisphaerales bacterium]
MKTKKTDLTEPLFKKIRLSDMNPAEYNPRVISDEALAGLTKSLTRFGCVEPIIVNIRDNRNVIVGGHQRHKALTELHGGDYECTCVVVDLSVSEEKTLNVTLNNPHIQGDFIDNLSEYIEQLRQEIPEQDYLDLEIDKLRGEIEAVEGLTDPDDVPAPPDEAITQPGDIWVLGNHRLMCGNSGNPADVDKLLNGEKIHLVNTDPPYNVCVAPRSQNARATSEASGNYTGQQGMDGAIQGKARKTTDKMRPKDRPLANDFVSDEDFVKLLQAWFGNIKRVLIPGRSYYIWGGYSNIYNYPNVIKELELKFSQMIIWVKEHPVLTRKDFMGNHEWCFYGWSEGAAHKFYGPANITDVWSVKKVNPQSMVHLTEKPVELAVRAMQYSSQAGENVLDLFGGSGSTLIAAEQTGRKAYLMELDPPYCDVIVQRWEKFTGKKAVLFNDKTPTAEAGVEEQK